MKKLLTQPLIHFLCLGLAFFLLFQWKGKNNSDERIKVTRDKLLTFMQYRSKAFNSEIYSKKLDAMNEKDRQTLIDDWVREEVLYREAKSLKLDKDDYVIKMRMIQKLKFITQGFIESDHPVKHQVIIDYFSKHKSNYFTAPTITFTHVYFDLGNQGDEVTEKRAQTTKALLNDKHIGFSEGAQYGDHFLYHTNYVERTPDFITSHFGETMAKAIFDISTSHFNQWLGPLKSPYGYHLVFVSDNKIGALPALDEIYDKVKQDAQRVLSRQKNIEAIDKIVERYQISVADLRS